jgi:hypothetical protein
MDGPQSGNSLERKVIGTFESLTGHVEGIDVRAMFKQCRNLRGLLFVLIGLWSIFLPLLFMLGALIGTRNGGFPLPMSDRLAFVSIALFPTNYVPLIAHRLLRRGKSKPALILAGVSSLYLLPLFPIGTYKAFGMLGVVLEMRNTPVWLYAAKDEANAMQMAREQLQQGLKGGNPGTGTWAQPKPDGDGLKPAP